MNPQIATHAHPVHGVLQCSFNYLRNYITFPFMGNDVTSVRETFYSNRVQVLYFNANYDPQPTII